MNVCKNEYVIFSCYQGSTNPQNLTLLHNYFSQALLSVVLSLTSYATNKHFTE